MPHKIRKWTRRAQEAAKEFGLGNLATKDVTGYSHNHISQCQLGKRWTSPSLAMALSFALDIPLHEFGQRITLDGRAVVLVAKKNHNKAGTPIMYREVRG